MQVVSVTFVAVLATLVAAGPARAHGQPYSSMAPLASDLMPEADEVALARSAAPKAISEAADVMVLRMDGHATVATGSYGFVCLVFFVPGDAAEAWGANLPGSPVIAADDPEDRATIMMMTVAHGSDGTPAPATHH